MRRLDNSVAVRLDAAVEGLVYFLLVFTPFAFGGAEAWSQFVVAAVAGAIAVLLAVRLAGGDRREAAWTWAYIPLAVFLLAPLLQNATLPADLVRAVSPNTASIQTDLLGMLPDGHRLADSLSVSFYPHATMTQWRLVCAIAILFFAVVNVFRTPARVMRLLTVVMLVGAGVAVLALLQIATGADRIYWIVPTPHPVAEAGPFVNHSHLGQFLNLSMGAALAVMFVRLHQGFTGRGFSVHAWMELVESRSGRWLWIAAGMIVLSMAAVFASLTRGGMISMLIAAALTTLLLTSRHSIRGRGWIMAVLALGAFICVLYVGFDAVYDRLASLRDPAAAESGRWQIVKDIAVAWRKFPLLGTGLGTHEVVYPMFDRGTIPRLAAHAENEYAQLAEEMGIVGIGCMLAFGAVICVQFVRCIRSAAVPIRSAAYGLGFGLTAILLHSLADFGQHLPANAALSAAFCGLLIALARMGEPEETGSAAAVRFRPVVVAGAVLVAAAAVYNLPGAYQARVAAKHWNRAMAMETQLAGVDWDAGNEEYADLIRAAAAAVEHQPRDAQYRHWLNVYRWRSISRAAGRLQPGAVQGELSGIVKQLVDEFHQVIALCPTYGPAWCMAGQLMLVGSSTGQEATAREYIRRGYELAPYDATTCYVAGYHEVLTALDPADAQVLAADPNVIPEVVDAAMFDTGQRKLARAVELAPELYRDICRLYVEVLRRPSLAVDLAGEDLWRLTVVTQTLDDSPLHEGMLSEVRARLIARLEALCVRDDAPAYALASLAGIYERRGQHSMAVEYYRQALVLDYGRLPWRMALARVLVTQNEVEEAMHQARICLRLHPQYEPAVRFIETWAVSVGPEAAP